MADEKTIIPPFQKVATDFFDKVKEIIPTDCKALVIISHNDGETSMYSGFKHDTITVLTEAQIKVGKLWTEYLASKKHT
jgi:hypothetical protein